MIYPLQVTVIIIISDAVVLVLSIWEATALVNREDIYVMIRQMLCGILDVGRWTGIAVCALLLQRSITYSRSFLDRKSSGCDRFFNLGMESRFGHDEPFNCMSIRHLGGILNHYRAENRTIPCFIRIVETIFLKLMWHCCCCHCWQSYLGQEPDLVSPAVRGYVPSRSGR